MATGFRKRSCSNKEVERDDDQTRSHRALASEIDDFRARAAFLTAVVGNLDGVRALGRRREPRRGEKMELAPVHKAVNVAGLEFADEFLFDLKPIEGRPKGLTHRHNVAAAAHHRDERRRRDCGGEQNKAQRRIGEI